MKDQFQRQINYMRLSVTDRCNLRCRYCMPKGMENVLPVEKLLSFSELLFLAEEASKLGISRFKVTGGEPLVRDGVLDFIKALKKLDKVEQVTLTTNGILLKEALPELLSAGIDGINVSLDSLKEERFEEITGFPALPKVLEGISAACDAGVRVKLNTVIQKGKNEDELFSLLALAKEHPLDIRFIEMMPIGYGRNFEPYYNEKLLEKIREQYPSITEDISVHGNGPAKYYRIPGFLGSVGFISALHGKFCGSCNRVRLTSEGELKPCLCYGTGYDLRAILRNTAFSEEEKRAEVEKTLRKCILGKPESHAFEKLSEVTEHRAMGKIGG